MTEQIKDTLSIQLDSLDAFSCVLGYWNNKFYTEYTLGVAHGFRGCETITMNTMVKLHNAVWLKSSKKGFYYPEYYPEIVGVDGILVRQSPFMLDGYTLERALAARISDKVFLQCDKHGVVTCHKHLLRLIDSSYYHLFIGE